MLKQEDFNKGSWNLQLPNNCSDIFIWRYFSKYILIDKFCYKTWGYPTPVIMYFINLEVCWRKELVQLPSL